MRKKPRNKILSEEYEELRIVAKFYPSLFVWTKYCYSLFLLP